MPARTALTLAIASAMLGSVACSGSPPAQQTTSQGETVPAPEPTEASPQSAPSFPAWLSQGDILNLTGDPYLAAAAPSVGHAVRWAVDSWGTETSAHEFDTPEAGPDTAAGRVRMAFPGVVGLAEVTTYGQPVLACSADMTHAPGALLRDDGSLGGPVVEGPVTLTGTIWGATMEGNVKTLWLRNCTLEPRTATEHGPVEAPPENVRAPILGLDTTTGELTTVGFPAIASDAQSVLISGTLEYGDPFVLLYGMNNQVDSRFDFPRSGVDLGPTIDVVRELVGNRGFIPMSEMEIVEPTDIRPGCRANQLCGTFNGTLVQILRGESEVLARFRPPPRRAQAWSDARCGQGRRAARPFRVEAWIEETEAHVLLRWSYRSRGHGCELPDEYRVLQLGS